MTSPMTYADYLALPDDGRRWQLIEGELFEMDAPNLVHQWIAGKLHRRLDELVEDRGLGFVFIAAVDVLLDDRTVVQPDILFVSAERRSILAGSNIAGAPDLCIEVLSPWSRSLDRLRKFRVYADHGVRAYWIVDPDAGTIEEYVLEGDAFVLKTTALRNEVFRSVVLDGFELVLEPLLTI